MCHIYSLFALKNWIYSRLHDKRDPDVKRTHEKYFPILAHISVRPSWCIECVFFSFIIIKPLCQLNLVFVARNTTKCLVWTRNQVLYTVNGFLMEYFNSDFFFSCRKKYENPNIYWNWIIQFAFDWLVFKFWLNFVNIFLAILYDLLNRRIIYWIHCFECVVYVWLFVFVATELLRLMRRTESISTFTLCRPCKYVYVLCHRKRVLVWNFSLYYEI